MVYSRTDGVPSLYKALGDLALTAAVFAPLGFRHPPSLRALPLAGLALAIVVASLFVGEGLKRFLYLAALALAAATIWLSDGSLVIPGAVLCSTKLAEIWGIYGPQKGDRFRRAK
jgi:hypothetical protein